MSVLKKIICGFVLITFTLGSYAQIKLPAAWQSSHIQISKEGILTYIPDKKGNLIPDFSRVGYINIYLTIESVK